MHQSVLECDARTHVLIGGDFNAWSQEWGSARNDQRGERLSDLAAGLNLHTENIGSKSTYRRINAESVIDVTFSLLVAPATIRGWRVLEEVESASDHRYIEFTHDPTPDVDDTGGNHARGWSFHQLDAQALAAHLSNTVRLNPTSTKTPRRHRQLSNSPPIWRQPATPVCLQGLRGDQEGSKLRRALQRSARRHDPCDVTDAHREAHKGIRKDLRNAVREAQAKSWSELCKAVDNDPWGLPYRVVTKRIGLQRPGVEARGREDSIADHLFPNLRQPTGHWNPDSRKHTPNLKPTSSLRKSYGKRALGFPLGKLPDQTGFQMKSFSEFPKSHRRRCLIPSTAASGGTSFQHYGKPRGSYYFTRARASR
ncbi:uncharacterized protein LOC132943647 [Metopolophium dirhodum]|uniref:uncharacterized protein LOC132943647 n=1 Tax=Metopolophium dirhodum TaxID=44670 RepID=UPI00299055B5|nr:uncharacterized protein LOC132943647 [Metopolophium dirhodum]